MTHFLWSFTVSYECVHVCVYAHGYACVTMCVHVCVCICKCVCVHAPLLLAFSKCHCNFILAHSASFYPSPHPCRDTIRPQDLSTHSHTLSSADTLTFHPILTLVHGPNPGLAKLQLLTGRSHKTTSNSDTNCQF